VISKIVCLKNGLTRKDVSSSANKNAAHKLTHIQTVYNFSAKGLQSGYHRPRNVCITEAQQKEAYQQHHDL